MVIRERDVDLRAGDRQTKELKRIADRVRKIAIRDFTRPIAVIVAASAHGVAVKIGEALEEEKIEEVHPAKTDRFDPDYLVTDEEAEAVLASAME